jgi:penicillin-binding protein 1A
MLIRIAAFLFAMGSIAVVVVASAGAYYLWRLNADLPEYDQLANYEPPVTTRVHAGDGSLIAEYAKERRLYVPLSAIPNSVIDAFLSAEDKNFYSHPGVDFQGVIRATIENVSNYLNDRRLEGASTITQQVAKNFLLSSEVSLNRKAKEALLAFKIEQTYTKQEILELYLNEIYLGFASYGVAAAALNYFEKSLNQLTLAEAAYLAALPKAPNNYHPIRRTEAAIARRNWVLDRMVENEFITRLQADEAKIENLEVQPRAYGAQIVEAQYFAEEVRREIFDIYGEDALYDGGLSIRTTLDMQLQSFAHKALRDGLTAYDRRHGWRGPVDRIQADENWSVNLASLRFPDDITPWRPAVVLSVSDDDVMVGFRDGESGTLPLKEIEWARPWLKGERLGPAVERPRDVLSKGDVIYVEPVFSEDDESEPTYFALRQIPAVNGGLIALDPHTGRVLAMVGGFSYQLNEFNRASQALRQTGSAFKPFVYAAALRNGYTPSSLVLDAPFVMDQGPGLALWKPENYSMQFYGPSTLRLGVEKSRNVMTVRLAQTIGMEPIIHYARAFGIKDDMPPHLSMALGAGETTLLKLTSAYAMLVNGGKVVRPTLIDRIQNRRGKTISRADKRQCADCEVEAWTGQEEPPLADIRDVVIDPATAYQLVSILEGVVLRGTGGTVRAVGKPLAGKTGTTNEERDAWFVGFSPDLAVGVYVGFDTPRRMGRAETGGRVAAPIFREFMKKAIGDKPAIPFRVPPGIRLVRVNAKTGLLAQPGDYPIILEAFKPGTEPEGPQPVIGQGATVGDNIGSGTGGLY